MADGTILVGVRLAPRAFRDRIGGIWRDADGLPWLSASVRAVPEKGRANLALIALLADALAVAPGLLSIDAGASSRLKRVKITSDPATMVARLEQLVDGT